jgi:fructose-specific phosphotransferase system IIC component
MNTSTITTETGVITDTDRQLRFYFALIFALLSAHLIALVISALHAILHNKLKWVIGILILPLVAFIYLFLNRKSMGPNHR